MNLRRKSKSWYRIRRIHTWKLMVVTFVVIVAALILVQNKGNVSRITIASLCQPIDVIYTWVNGSDPSFIDSIRQFHSTYDKSRFDDKNELKYSLRSLEKYAPWVRNIYIVTNGQVPRWLDLSNERIRIVPHELLVPKQWLPFFSSAAIETFIHRIPNLSARFLYLNDDIFLGAELYPEDLYTDSEGVRIYQAWIVPDCATNCPWIYIGDDACDPHCNIKQCQYDGGDCSKANSDINKRKRQEVVKSAKVHMKTNKKPLSNANIKIFPRRNDYYTPLKSSNNRTNSFKGVLIKHHKMSSNKSNMRALVDNFNRQLRYNEHIQGTFITDNKSTNKLHVTYNSTDIFSRSLIHTNMLLNRRYGFKARHVIGHVGLLLETSIIEAMQKEFSQEILTTATHRFRSSNDLQFSFLYYSFLMEEVHSKTVDQIFNEFDTDHSSTWSDREIRTFLAKIFPLPLDWSAKSFLEEVIHNCSFVLRSNGKNEDLDARQYTTIEYERYGDSHLPTVTRDLVKKCPPLVEALKSNFGSKTKYKYKINSRRNIHNNFMMLTSNVTDVVNELDKMRKKPRKFNCINDNLDAHTEDNELIRHILEDFYLSLFPHRSQFELDPQYRNRFENWRDYLKWRKQQRLVIIVIYGSCIIIFVYFFHSIFMHKAKFLRLCIRNF